MRVFFFPRLICPLRNAFDASPPLLSDLWHREDAIHRLSTASMASSRCDQICRSSGPWLGACRPRLPGLAVLTGHRYRHLGWRINVLGSGEIGAWPIPGATLRHAILTETSLGLRLIQSGHVNDSRSPPSGRSACGHFGGICVPGNPSSNCGASRSINAPSTLFGVSCGLELFVTAVAVVFRSGCSAEFACQ